MCYFILTSHFDNLENPFNMRNQKINRPRKHFKPCLRFNEEILNKIINDQNSQVVLQNSLHHLALYPNQLQDIKASINHVLDAEMHTYNPKLRGIPIGYRNVRCKSNLGQIVNDTCYIHIDVEVEFYVFKPKKNRILQGVVNKKSKDHIGCLVHQIFNVSVPRPDNDEEWLGRSIKVNSEVAIRVTHTNFNELLPYIQGEITEVLKQPEVNESQEPESKKRKILD